ncbi:MAG: hypothetical protein LBS56_07265 [Propionibacteriaceae bacterium]|jgi:hypothetical protein|nr:hypothetical protein [Propionibacteriaceae bacterium]
MARVYRRKTGWKPQADRRFAVRAEVNAPIDVRKFVDACMMHVLSSGLPDQAQDPNRVRFTGRAYPRGYRPRFESE